MYRNMKTIPIFTLKRSKATAMVVFCRKKEEKLYMYTYPDGTVIEYYLNEHDIPYTYIDGEQVYVVVTLDRYVVYLLYKSIYN